MDTNDYHIARLESEIRFLKGLLDENGIPYDYGAYMEVVRHEEPVEIGFPVLTAEHAIRFYSYFRGREDVYVKRNAKKGYYTQCNNFWKTHPVYALGIDMGHAEHIYCSLHNVYRPAIVRGVVLVILFERVTMPIVFPDLSWNLSFRPE